MTKRIVKQQKAQVIDKDRAKSICSNEIENQLANPDLLPESDAINYQTEEQKDLVERVRVLIQEAKQVLTEKQHEVFALKAQNLDMSFNEIARILNLHLKTVQERWEQAQKKLQPLYRKLEANDNE